MARYRVLQGIDYPPNKRAEAGKIVEDLPATSVKWLLESGIIEDADKPTKESKHPSLKNPRLNQSQRLLKNLSKKVLTLMPKILMATVFSKTAPHFNAQLRE
jgi:hypothetical protein